MTKASPTKRYRGDILIWIVPVLTALVGVFMLGHWFSIEPEMEFSRRLPDPNDYAPFGGDAGDVEVEGTLVQFDGVPAADVNASWPRFRGANLDAVSVDETTLARTWPAEGPPTQWTIDVGEGYAGAAVSGGRVYIMDYDYGQLMDVVRCVSLADGRDIWQYRYPVKVKRNHGMSRTIPTVTDKYVVAFGPKCHVTCLDAATGELKWLLDLVREHGAKVPAWYAGQCPLVEDGKAILGVGGEDLIMAVDCETGEILWRTENPNKWVMTHSSVLPLEFNGVQQYVYCASGGVVGVAVDDGHVLWEFKDWMIKIANVPTPVIVGDGRIFLSGGYNAGSVMLKLKADGDKIVAEEQFRLDADTFGSAQHTPIFYDGHIYGVRPDEQLTCLDLDGKVVWTSGTAHKFGLGPYTIANGLIYVLDDEGTLTLAEATPTRYVKLSEAKVLEGPDAWGPMAVVDGKLILRDLNKMACIDIGQQ